MNFPMQEETPPRAPFACGHWLREGARSAVFLAPRMQGLHASPMMPAVLVALMIGFSLLLQRAMLTAPVIFYWQAVTGGWLPTLLLLWTCWVVARRADADRAEAPTAATLFTLLLAQQAILSIPLWLLFVGAGRLAQGVGAAMWVQTGLSYLMIGWVALAGIVLLCRQCTRGNLRVAVVAMYLLTVVIDLRAPNNSFWYPDETAARRTAGETEVEPLHLTPEMFESQSAAVIRNLDALQPQRPGVVDVYAITFAPYAGEEVFRRESNVVAATMRDRFDAGGRTIQLINHAQTAAELPWATRLNLQRAIQRAASVMNRDEDVLFVHMTSHGARNGELATSFWPIEVDPVTPALLRQWLDAAGIRYRVLSISACFAGAWVPALAEPGTLVMTASDADHTSYGCGRKSELTFFGRAMYAEELRRTRSFEAAHAAARKVIQQREVEAGKTDGYSNPQIAVGDAIRPKLEALQARLDAAGP